MRRYKLIENGVVVPLTEAEEAEWTIWESQADERAAEEVRDSRNAKLAATDWRAGNDLIMSDEWKAYRQALRDIPAQSGFPNDITWPSEPS